MPQADRTVLLNWKCHDDSDLLSSTADGLQEHSISCQFRATLYLEPLLFYNYHSITYSLSFYYHTTYILLVHGNRRYCTLNKSGGSLLFQPFKSHQWILHLAIINLVDWAYIFETYKILAPHLSWLSTLYIYSIHQDFLQSLCCHFPT